VPGSRRGIGEVFGDLFDQEGSAAIWSHLDGTSGRIDGRLDFSP
jgi:hypothetical protein